MIDNIYIGDIGTIIKVDTDEDLTGATGLSLVVKKPDDTIVSWSASISDTQYLSHTIGSGEIDMIGYYCVQAAFTLGSWSGRGKPDKFKVYETCE